MSVAHLARISLFGGLPAAELERLAASCSEARRSAGEFLYDRAGEAPECVFAVIEGEIEVLLGNGTPEPVLLGSIGPGGLAGEFAAIAGRPDLCVLRARTET